MSELSQDFSRTAAPASESKPPRKRRQRVAPFSLRLSPAEKDYLRKKAGKTPLGAYIKAKTFADGEPAQGRRSGLAVEDRKVMAQALALLGGGRYASNLHQIANAAHIGALPITPELEEELRAACRHVAEVKALLIQAIGLKEGGEK